MKFNGRITTLLGSLTLFCSSVTASPVPEVCPSVEAIKGQGLSYAYNLLLDLYLTYQDSNYDTDKSWEFAVGIIQAEDEDGALMQANGLVSSLSGQPSPEEIEPGSWACTYKLADDNYIAAAFYSEFALSPNKIKSYFMHRKA